MKKFIVFIILINTLSIFSQRDKMILPNGFGREIQFSNTFITPLFSVYLNKNKELYFEDKKLNFEQLGDTIFKYRNLIKPDLVISTIIQFYGDKNLSYRDVENVKDQLISASMLRFMYRTDNIEDVSKGFFVRLGKATYPKKDKPLTKNALKKIGIGKNSIDEVEDELYNFNFEKVKTLLKRFNYKEIYFIKNGKIKIGKEKFSSEEINKVFDLLKETEFVFLNTSPKTSYKDYLRNLILLSNLYKENKKRFALIEITNRLKQRMNKKNFILSK